MKRQLRLVPLKEDPYCLINVLGPFSVIVCNRLNFHKVQLTDTSSTGKIARKSRRYLVFRLLTRI